MLDKILKEINELADRTRMGQNDLKILVVDDDEDMRATLLHFISKMGVTVRTAGDVGEARRLLSGEPAPFDIVLADLKLPGGSGLDIVRAAHARCPDSLVTIVTGFASLETAIEAIRLGAYDYITKPFSLDEIGVQVRNMIARVSLSKENARLSLRLQELYEQVNRLQRERLEMTRYQEETHRDLMEVNRKLDILLSTRTNGGARAQSVDPYPDKTAIANLFIELENLDRLKGTGASPSELEERKRSLLQGLVEKL
jgi:ActR/RegA family two-component response regulator